jgi:hypothetical protein
MRAMAAARRGGAAAVPALAWTLLGTMAGCRPGGGPPVVSKLMPVAAYNDTSVAASITSDQESFRPTYRIDARSGATAVDPGGFSATLSPSGYSSGAPVAMRAVVWQSLDLLAAEIPAATPAGIYDLVVRDPRGASFTLPRAFQALGPDMQPPLVRIASPAMNTVFAGGATVPVVVVADDDRGTVTSLTVVMSSGSGAEQTYTCAVTGQAVVSCPFTFPAPGPASRTDLLTITATATGTGGLIGVTRAAFPLALRPSINSFYPNNGTTRGGTFVTIAGENLADGASVSFDGLPATIQSQTQSSITAITPPHPIPGTVHISVTTASVTLQLTGQFTYVASPRVRAILPASGPAAGGFPVTIIGDNFVNPTTQILFGTATPLRCPTFVNANRIDGLAPPGVGTQAVTAVDSVSGAIPNATVPFHYTEDGDSTGPSTIDADASQTAGVAGSDGGAPDADTDTDAAAPDGGCPLGPS